MLLFKDTIGLCTVQSAVSGHPSWSRNCCNPFPWLHLSLQTNEGFLQLLSDVLQSRNRRSKNTTIGSCQLVPAIETFSDYSINISSWSTEERLSVSLCFISLSSLLCMTNSLAGQDGRPAEHQLDPLKPAKTSQAAFFQQGWVI